MKDLKTMRSFHFIGIGGVSMSALAKLMLARGKRVTGSDAVRSPVLKDLLKLGVRARVGNNPSGIHGADMVIYTAAVGQDNSDLILAEQLGKVVLERAQFLGLVSQSFTTVVAVSGTHGKTSTTAMIAEILLFSGHNPTVHLGGELKSIGGNLHLGSPHLFVTEACEFNRSFLYMRPDVSVITNIEADHMNCYADLNDLVNAFNLFANQTNDLIVLGGDCALSKEIQPKCAKVTFGFGASDYYARNLIPDSGGCFAFDVYKNERLLFNVQLRTQGRHQVQNALAAIAVCKYLEAEDRFIKQALEAFEGVERRFTQYKLNKEILAVHDYAHHPTEIKAAVETAKLIAKGRIICVFEPHTYTRTQYLMQEFGTAFAGIDALIMLPTYAAREKEIAGARAQDILPQIKDVPFYAFFNEADTAFDALLSLLKPHDTVLFLGAGTIGGYAQDFVSKYKKAAKTP